MNFARVFAPELIGLIFVARSIFNRDE